MFSGLETLCFDPRTPSQKVVNFFSKTDFGALRSCFLLCKLKEPLKKAFCGAHTSNCLDLTTRFETKPIELKVVWGHVSKVCGAFFSNYFVIFEKFDFKLFFAPKCTKSLLKCLTLSLKKTKNHPKFRFFQIASNILEMVPEWSMSVLRTRNTLF